MGDVQERLTAALADRYRVERQLGEGGMATVYLAHDLRHDRRVAIKVLRPQLAAVVGADRFLAEIRTTAGLQHPHILPLFDSGQADSFLFYVMPYVDGESLRERLDRERQLPVAEAVRIATDLAEALDYAHQKGVIHRDIKPANVLLLAGKPVIADFGIALAVGAAGGGRLTETGLSLGTPHYMSPEQATGSQHIGPATDIYALGCVLYEMLVGEPPYPGVTPHAVLGKIIAGDFVPVVKHRKTVPANVDAAIRKALEKVPADRFGRAGEIGEALQEPAFRHGERGEVAAHRTSRLTLITSSFAVLFAVLAGWSLMKADPPRVQRFRMQIENVGRPDLLPDGSGMVYGTGPLFLRRWESLEPVPIAGTEGVGRVGAVFVSPSGTEVAFITAGDTLTVVPIGGGVPRMLADSAAENMGWSPDGFLYYPPAVERNLRRVPASGGASEEVTTRGSETGHGFFQLLPGGEVGIFSTTVPPFQIEAIRMSTGERKPLIAGTKPYYTATGHLVFATGDGRIGQIMAAGFDPESLEVTGPPVPLVQGIAIRFNGIALYSLSPNGTLVYVEAASPADVEFVWVTRSGDMSDVDPGATFGADGRGWRISPDGSRVALTNATNGNVDVWIKELPRGPLTRFTFTDAREQGANWSPDGNTVGYALRPVRLLARDSGQVWIRGADGAGTPRMIHRGRDVRDVQDLEWSPNGSWLVLNKGDFTGNPRAGGRDILVMRPDVDTVPRPLVASPEFAEGGPAISRDGRWLAYVTNKSGREEVFVRPFPNVDEGEWQISKDGGIQPLWAHNGRELFFVDPTANAMKVVEFTSTAGTFRPGPLTTLFTIPASVYRLGDLFGRHYDVSLDDSRFLMARASGTASTTESVVLVQNFFEDLKARVPRRP